jgi:plasmid stabilization system protein ParE
MRIIWYSKAEQDLNSNIAFIAQSSPENAMKVLEEIMLLTDSLLLFPYKYPKEPIYNVENIRFVTKWSYKIIYRVESDIIYVLRIFNTRQSSAKM